MGIAMKHQETAAWTIDPLTSPGPATSPQHLVVVSHEQWYLPAMVDLVIYRS